MLARLRVVPITLPTLVAVMVMAWWELDKGGFAVAVWAPGGLAMVGLLTIAVLTVPGGWRTLPRAVIVAAAALGAYTLWSFGSIGWADDPGYAFEGAGRTLLYLVVFCLFALWPQRGATAGWVLGAIVAAIGLAAVVTTARLAGDPSASALVGSGRLKAPTGYPNATAGLMLMGLLPAVMLAASDRVTWWLRGVLTATAVLLSSLALLAVSRGSVYSLPVVLVLLFVLVPGRLRHLLTLVPVGLAVAACARRLIDVGDVADAGGDVAAAAERALGPVLVAAVVAGAVVALGAAVRARHPPGVVLARRLELTGRALALAALVVVLAGGAAAVGDPVKRVRSGWSSFKGGYEDNDAGRNRLVAGLGSNRYDFYRVALMTFRENPVAGVGADGFFQPYLRAGRSSETPRYPHSLELRTLAQTGIVGAALLLTAVGAALVAALRAMRTGDRLRDAVAGAATMGFLYWLVHGSLDWFWEWAGLGVPAFAFLGLACALAPRRGEEAGPPSAAGSAVARLGVVGVAVLLALPFASLWMAADAQTRAAEGFRERPQASYRLLDRAAALNPFSAAPSTLHGSIALRLGDLPRADAAFGRALGRVPDDQYATLERGAVASARGDATRARPLLERALELAPRDRLARDALQVVREGGTVDVAELNRRILAAAREITG